MRSDDPRRAVRPPLRAAIVLLIAAGALAAPQSVGAALSASIADLVLPAVTYSHASQVTVGTLTLSVSDSAPGAGWNVTIQSSALVYGGEFGGTSIPAANLSITDAAPPVLVSGQAIDPAGGPKVPAAGSTGTLDVARKTIQAEPEFGGGTYTQALGVALLIPAGSRAGSYVGTLTVTITAGP